MSASTETRRIAGRGVSRADLVIAVTVTSCPPVCLSVAIRLVQMYISINASVAVAQRDGQ